MGGSSPGDHRSHGTMGRAQGVHQPLECARQPCACAFPEGQDTASVSFPKHGGIFGSCLVSARSPFSWCEIACLFSFLGGRGYPYPLCAVATHGKAFLSSLRICGWTRIPTIKVEFGSSSQQSPEGNLGRCYFDPPTRPLHRPPQARLLTLASHSVSTSVSRYRNSLF